MHGTSLFFYQGWWYGRCSCGWTSGAYQTQDGAVGACMTHEEAQMN